MSTACEVVLERLHLALPRSHYSPNVSSSSNNFTLPFTLSSLTRLQQVLRKLATMSSIGFGKRLGFKRSSAEQKPVTPTKVGNDDGQHAGGRGDAKPVINEFAADISETVANHRLAIFRNEHRWDPNMPDDAIEIMDAANETHDHKDEAQLVSEVIENSPYPEVSAVHPCLFNVANDHLGPRCRSELRPRRPGKHTSSMDYRSDYDYYLLQYQCSFLPALAHHLHWLLCCALARLSGWSRFRKSPPEQGVQDLRNDGEFEPRTFQRQRGEKLYTNCL
jgi:hypothetical protein